MVNLHVFTLSWNGLDKLNKLKTGLFDNLNYIKENKNINYLWNIRDNGSKDNTVKEVNSWISEGLPINLTEVGHNRLNFSQGMNCIFKNIIYSDNDLILLLNNDITFEDNKSLFNMLNLMKDDVGIVGSKLLFTGTNKLQHAGIVYSNYRGGNAWNYRTGEIDDSDASKNRYFQGVSGAVLLTKAKIYEEVNGLSEDLHWAFDDCDYGLKIKQLGKKIIYCGDTKIFHENSASLKKNPVNTLFLNENLRIFKTRWFGKYEIDHDKYLKNKNYNEIK